MKDGETKLSSIVDGKRFDFTGRCRQNEIMFSSES